MQLPLNDFYLSKLRDLQINIEDIQEKHIHGSGKGGQKVNKTASCVQLQYKPLNIIIKCQDFRELKANRKRAYKRLVDLIELQKLGKNSKLEAKFAKIRRKKSKKKTIHMTPNANFLILLSPSKSQDFNSLQEGIPFQTPEFLLETQELVQVLQSKNPEELAQLMSISEKLAHLNFERFQTFQTNFTKNNAKPALFAFTGDVYNSFDLNLYGQSDLEYASKHLRIISGLYGLLDPLDVIQPYRLEMKTKLNTKKGTNLYQFWGNKLTQTIQDLNPDYIINLASVEYSKAINLDLFKGRVITPVFLKENANGELKNIAIYAKKARGAMADFIIRNRTEDITALQKFSWKGYRFLKNSNPKKPEFVL